ncbi:hypothetical protein GDO81_011920 [Engystomops pustulosus]|uniref:Uncharacterized protein n=1 Tax=Engystomops pustulosus TaxID=76066 RepID=A0AAV7BIB1_ENGPU|nr:hypothetical protein GDO81_011920 [Engystomops pustulosus]
MRSLSNASIALNSDSSIQTGLAENTNRICGRSVILIRLILSALDNSNLSQQCILSLIVFKRGSRLISTNRSNYFAICIPRYLKLFSHMVTCCSSSPSLTPGSKGSNCDFAQFI